MTEIDLILPCYNPQENWTSKIVSSLKEIERLSTDLRIHLILVNDGSSPLLDPSKINSLKEQIPRFTYIDNPTNKGKGHALRTGFAQSKNEICIFTDIDFPFTAQSFVNVYNTLTTEDCELAVGVRDYNYYSKIPFGRKVISKLLKQLIKLFFALKLSDTQCGLKGFKPLGKELFLQTTINRYLFDLELIQAASRKIPNQIIGVPIILKEGIVFSKINSKIIVQESFNFLRIFFKSLLK